MKALQLLSRFATHQTFIFRQKFSTLEAAMKIGIVQVNSTSDKESNFQKCKDLIIKSKSEGAKMIFLPEAFDFIGTSSAETREMAEPIDGPLITRYRSLARDENVWLSLGGFHRKLDGDERVANCHLVLNGAGDIAASYEKTHLFDVDIPGKVQLQESRYVRPGQTLPPVVSTPVGPVGLAICYDIRFPELSLSVRESGADLLTFPSAFSVPTGKAGHWEVLNRARAIETQCWVVSAALCGSHNPKRASYGHSLVVDPWGRVVCDLGEEEGAATVEIDAQRTLDVRAEMPVAKQRRHDLYPTLTLQTRLPDPGRSFDFGGRDIPGAHVFLCSQRSFAFVNLSPVVPGHMLVSPVRCARRLADLTEPELCDLYRTSLRVARGVERFYGTSSLTIACQDGPDAGQTVEHVHIHILPRRKDDFFMNDEIYAELEERTEKPRVKRTDEEMTKEAAIFRELFFGKEKDS